MNQLLCDICGVRPTYTFIAVARGTTHAFCIVCLEELYRSILTEKERATCH